MENTLVAEQDIATAAGPDDFVFDPYSMEYALDPYPFYEWMRENAPVFPVSQHTVGGMNMGSRPHR